MELVNTLDVIQNKESSLNEESSYHFLKDLQVYKNWYVYSSKEYPLKAVTDLANKFCYSHGMITLKSFEDKDDEEIKYFWSSVPLGLFRYKMLSDGSPASISYFDKNIGYIVEGVYWLNGFVYQVRNNDFVLEVNLFIDDQTKVRYNYTDTKTVY
jgi:hypothetical protein